MEDENKVTKILDIIKKTFLILLIFGIIIVSIMSIFRKINENALNKYLSNNGYTKDIGMYFKNITNQTEENTETINYIYDTKLNKLVKTITNMNSNYQEEVDLTYNGSNTIKTKYIFTDNSKSGNNTISQTGTYEYKKGKYKCTIDYTLGDITSKCGNMKTYTEEFSKEIKEIIQKANINEFFAKKNAE